MTEHSEFRHLEELGLGETQRNLGAQPGEVGRATLQRAVFPCRRANFDSVEPLKDF